MLKVVIEYYLTFVYKFPFLKERSQFLLEKKYLDWKWAVDFDKGLKCVEISSVSSRCVDLKVQLRDSK